MNYIERLILQGKAFMKPIRRDPRTVPITPAQAYKIKDLFWLCGIGRDWEAKEKYLMMRTGKPLTRDLTKADAMQIIRELIGISRGQLPAPWKSDERP